MIKETLSDGTINSYEYDAVGNRTQSDVNGIVSTFTYNDANQIKTKNDTAFEYDADGNLLKDENYHYTYNEQQHLTQVKKLDGSLIASYTYDENGLRLTKKVGNTTHEYFYNNGALDMEVVKVNDVVTEYRSYEWSGYTPLGMIVKAKNDANTFEAKAYQFITNHRGDVLSIRDSEDNEVASYTYDAYGNILTAKGPMAKENPIRYAGYYYDEETKNYYLQARYYNPANGSFLALDPHPGDEDEPLSQNGYSYANGNPTINFDPTGDISRKLKFTIYSALFFLFKELVGVISAVTIIGTVSSAYGAYVNHIMQNKPTSYTKIISDIKHNKKKIIKAVKKQARKVAIKVGLRTIFPISILAAVWALTKGGYKGYKHYKKYKKYGARKFVEKIYKEYA